MPAITNVSPIGDLDVPLLRRVVAAGESVEVTDDQARRLLPQVDSYAPADMAASALLAELVAASVALAETDPDIAPIVEPAGPANEPEGETE